MNTHLLLQLRGKLVLRVDGPRADQLQDLALAVALVHGVKRTGLETYSTRQRASRASASARACATAFGPAPPGSSRVFKPSAGWKNRIMSAVNSGANAVS